MDATISNDNGCGRYNGGGKMNNLADQYEKAKTIIKNMKKTGRDLFPKAWDTIDFDVRQQALEDFKHYVKCECGCRDYFKTNRMVSFQGKMLFYKHAGHTEESFLRLGAWL